MDASNTGAAVAAAPGVTDEDPPAVSGLSPPLKAALSYRKRGWAVFPLKPHAKQPLTSRGLLDATRDTAPIVDWWRRWPDANIGVRTGAESNLLAVDIDGADGHDTLAELERAHAPLPATISTATGRGGHHYLFQHPGRTVRNSAGRLGPGVDVRCDGGYIVAPPSLHPTGRRYEWDSAPDETKLASLPGWLERLLGEQPNGHARPASEWRKLAANGVTEGARNHAVAQLAGHLLGRQVDPFVTLELVLAWNRNRNRPPLRDGEVTRTCESIAARELAKKANRRVST